MMGDDDWGDFGDFEVAATNVQPSIDQSNVSFASFSSTLPVDNSFDDFICNDVPPLFTPTMPMNTSSSVNSLVMTATELGGGEATSTTTSIIPTAAGATDELGTSPGVGYIDEEDLFCTNHTSDVVSSESPLVIPQSPTDTNALTAVEMSPHMKTSVVSTSSLPTCASSIVKSLESRVSTLSLERDSLSVQLEGLRGQKEALHCEVEHLNVISARYAKEAMDAQKLVEEQAIKLSCASQDSLAAIVAQYSAQAKAQAAKESAHSAELLEEALSRSETTNAKLLQEAYDKATSQFQIQTETACAAIRAAARLVETEWESGLEAALAAERTRGDRGIAQAVDEERRRGEVLLALASKEQEDITERAVALALSKQRAAIDGLLMEERRQWKEVLEEERARHRDLLTKAHEETLAEHIELLRISREESSTALRDSIRMERERRADLIKEETERGVSLLESTRSAMATLNEQFQSVLTTTADQVRQEVIACVEKDIMTRDSFTSTSAHASIALMEAAMTQMKSLTINNNGAATEENK